MKFAQIEKKQQHRIVWWLRRSPSQLYYSKTTKQQPCMPIQLENIFFWRVCDVEWMNDQKILIKTIFISQNTWNKNKDNSCDSHVATGIECVYSLAMFFCSYVLCPHYLPFFCGWKIYMYIKKWKWKKANVRVGVFKKNDLPWNSAIRALGSILSARNSNI